MRVPSSGRRLLSLDVTDAASVTAAVQAVPALDILVNNAGISGDGTTVGTPVPW